MGIFYTEVYPDRSGNMEIIGRKSFTTLNIRICRREGFHGIQPRFRQNFVSSSYAEKFRQTVQ
jgi:hypothetical protein